MNFRIRLFVLSTLLWLLLTSEKTKFSHLTIKDGLSQSSVKCLLQDSQGFLWVGTADGLNRFDGYNFEIVNSNPENPFSISGNDISCIYESPYDKTLWVGTQSNGLNKYSRERDNFYSFSHYPNCNPPVNHITDILTTGDSTTWVATRTGSLYYYVASDSCFKNPNFSKNEKFRTINCLEKDEMGNIWLATPQGLYRWDYTDKENNTLPEKVEFSVDGKNQSVTSLKFDIKGNLWIGTFRSGLFRYHPKSGKASHYMPGSSKNALIAYKIYDILATRDGEIWVATSNGVCRFLHKSNGFEVFRNDPNNPESLNDNTVYSLLEDRSGIIWIGTYLRGLNKIDPNQSRFPKINSFSKISQGNALANDIRAITVDDSNTIWLGTTGGLIEMKNENTASAITGSDVKIHFKRTNIGAIVATPEGIIFSKAGGIFLLDNENRAIELSKQMQAQNKFVVKGFSSGITDDLNQVWLATSKGLLKYIAAENKFELFNPKGPDGEPISIRPIAIKEDQTGKIWLGTLYGNLYSFDKYTNSFELVINSNQDDKLRSFTRIFSICTSVPNQLWLGTNLGLYNYNLTSGTIVRYIQPDGLSNNVVYGVVADKTGNIWCSTNLGISHLDTKTKEFRNYTYQDGLQSNEFNQGAYFNDASGKIFFGGMDGLNIFDPDKITQNSYIPQIVITGMEIQYEKVTPLSHPKITDKQISEVKELSLNHKQNTFSFKFTSLSFSLPERNQYRYSLTETGDTDKWINSGNNRIATYTNVPPGNYTFKVKGSNSDGLFNETGASIKISIIPPYWQTWWFRILVLLLGTGAVYLIIYNRTKRISRQKIILKKLVTEKTKKLVKQTQQIEIQNEELKLINERIRSKNDNITQKNKQLSEQHLQISKQRDGLLKLADRVSEINQAKFRFFTSISHELRVPLTLVLNPLKDVIGGIGRSSKKETLRKLNIIYGNASKLLIIVNQLLDFRKAETDNMKLQVSEFELTPFLQKSAFLFNDLAARKNIDFSFSSEAANLKIWADRDKMEKMMYNLLSNAFKATQNEGRIKIHIWEAVEQERKFAAISVKDDGVGMERNKIPLIFERFYQIEDDTNLYNSGSGLGLALVKKYVDLHNGSIVVESAPGKGTEFVIKLPEGRAHFGEQVKFQEQQTEGKELMMASIGEYLMVSPGEEGAPNSREKSTLLLIEDDKGLRTYMSEVLAAQYNIELAENAKMAVKLAEQKKPDLIICDVILPGTDGFTLCKKLKSEFKTGHIPVILLTSLADNESRMKGLKAGADDYISKPFDLQHLILSIENLIEGRLRLQQKYSLTDSDNKVAVAVSSKDDVFMKETVACIEKNMANSSFNVEMLCEQMKMSQPQCYRKIKAATGYTISEFIRNTRLKEAAKLLESGKYRISEAAYETGFNDPSYFTRSFTKLFGITPSDYSK